MLIKIKYISKLQQKESLLLKKRNAVSLIFVYIGLLFTQFSYAQESEGYSNQLASQLHKESNANISDLVYLQTSKGIYETEEDLWFKGYVLDSQHLIPSLRSTMLYVQLVNDSTDVIVWNEKYKIEQGFVDGHIRLHDSLSAGNYSLKAYSAHSFFKNTTTFHALRQLKIVKNIVDLKQPKKPEKQDSIYSFNIYPEGGNLVSGIQTKVGFKALNQSGLPKEVSGVLYENGKPLLGFKSLHAGMGNFVFTPNKTNSYYIKLTDSLSTEKFELPTIYSQGKTLALQQNTKEKLNFIISQSEGLPEEKIYVRLQMRGITHNVAEGTLKNKLVVSFPTKNLPQGIAEVTLFNKDLEPVAERLVYINLDKKIYIKAELNKEKYTTRENAILKLKATDENGAPVISHLGLSVYDRIYQNKADTKTIESHYQLSTQLKGRLYHPSYYFEEHHKNRKQALDNLLLTQGWRRYLWQEENLKHSYKTIKQQVFSDSLKAKLYLRNATKLKKLSKRPEAEEYVMAYHPGKSLKEFIPTDSLNHFYIKSKHFKIGEKGFMYLKPLTQKKTDYAIHIENLPIELIERYGKDVKDVYPIQQEIILREIPEEYKKIKGVEQLDEVLLKAKKQKVYRDKYIRTLDSLAKLDFTLDYICSNPEHKECDPTKPWKMLLCRTVDERRVGVLNCPIHPHDKTKRRPVEGEVYALLLDENKRSIEPYGFNTVSDVISYRYVFKLGRDLSESQILRHFNFKMLKGLYGKREFYHQVYDKENINDDFFDARNTLFWKPDIITNENGEATIEFYCSDINSLYLGEIEGVSGNGLLGRDEFEFTVKKVE